jgi:hypothetical protein
MADRGRPNTHGDHAVFKLVVDYVHCPQCDLTVPAFTGPEPLAAVTEGTMTRCGFCKWVFTTGPRQPLEVRASCADCGTTMRSPVGAAVLVCPMCEGWFYNPELDATERDRAEAVLNEQHRIASMVDRFLLAADHLIPASRESEDEDVAAHGGMSGYPAHSRGPAPLDPAGSRGTQQRQPSPQHPVHPTAHRPPAPRSGSGNSRPDSGRADGTRPTGNVRSLHGRRRSSVVDHEPALDGEPITPSPIPEPAVPESPTVASQQVGAPMTVAFAGALHRAVQDVLGPRHRRVLELRYGLDGRPGRTFDEIGAALRRSPSRARAILAEGVATIVELARAAEAGHARQHVSCSLAVHIAAHAVGDPHDAQAPCRVRAFVDAALPAARPSAATDLLLRLAGLRDELVPTGHDRALRRAVTAARPDPAG